MLLTPCLIERPLWRFCNLGFTNHRTRCPDWVPRLRKRPSVNFRSCFDCGYSCSTPCAPPSWRRHRRPGPLRSAVERPTALPAGVVVEYHPLERHLLAAAGRGTLDNRLLLRAALVANGVTDGAALARHEARFAKLRDRLTAEPDWDDRGSPRQRARVVLEFLHREVLDGGYRLRCSNVSETLVTGKYNCITATVLFNCLAAHVGLKVRGGEAPGHVVSLLLEPERTTRVETTCARWFDLLEDPSRRAAYVPPDAGHSTRPRKIRRELNAAQLVATIYYNRGVDALERRQYARAVAANAKALRFDPASTTARGNLLAAVNNWALRQAEAGDFARALSTLEDGRRMAPRHEPFRVNVVVLQRKWAQRLADSGDYAAALAVLRRDVPGAEQSALAELQSDARDVYRRWRDALDKSEAAAQRNRRPAATNPSRPRSVPPRRPS